MSFEYPDIETKEQKPSKPRMITRKIRFETKAFTNEGWLIVTANKVALKYGGCVLRYRIRSCVNISSIIFRCPEDKWTRLHYEFVGETNGRIEKVRCNRL